MVHYGLTYPHAEKTNDACRAGNDRPCERDGTWQALRPAQQLVIPNDLQTALDTNPNAKTYFDAFPPSSKSGILDWILNARRSETRVKRIEETAWRWLQKTNGLIITDSK